MHRGSWRSTREKFWAGFGHSCLWLDHLPPPLSKVTTLHDLGVVQDLLQLFGTTYSNLKTTGISSRGSGRDLGLMADSWVNGISMIDCVYLKYLFLD